MQNYTVAKLQNSPSTKFPITKIFEFKVPNGYKISKLLNSQLQSSQVIKFLKRYKIPNPISPTSPILGYAKVMIG